MPQEVIMKKNRIFLSIFVLIIASALLSSCAVIDSLMGKAPTGKPTEPTEHKLVKVDELPATCTQNGSKEYYTCTGCDLIFADAEGTVLLDAPEVIAAGHTPEIVFGTAPTCTENGYTASRKCSVCDEILTPAKELKAAHDVAPTASITGFSLKTVDKRAYVVLYGNNIANNVCGTCGTTVAPKIAMDFQHNDNIDGLGWGTVMSYADNNNVLTAPREDTVIKPAVTATVHDNGYFEAWFEVSDFDAGWTLNIHAGLDGNLADCKDYATGDGVAAYANGKKFSFLKDKTTTWNNLSLVVTEAAENDYNLNGRMSLEEADGIAYVVYNGSWNTENGDAASVKTAVENCYYSIQQFQNGWKTTVCTPVVEINEDGSLKVKLSLAGYATTGTSNPYYMHRGVTEAKQNDIKIHTDFFESSIVVGGYQYKINKGCDLDTTWTTTLTVIYITEVEA